MNKINEGFINVFIEKTHKSLQKIYPEQCLSYGDSKVKEIIRYGIDQSKTYNITKENEVFKYISLMFILGKNFDNDASLPHVKKILNDDNITNTNTKLMKIFETI